LRISSEKQLTSGRTVFHNPSPSGRGKGEGKREEAKPGVDSLLDHLVCNSVKITLILAFLLGVATLGYPAEPFYQGKTLRVVVASAAGGGSDIVARLMMRHLSRHIPGNPTIIVENMPGAAEIIGVNYVHNVAKPDGLTALFGTGIPIIQLLKLPGIEFDLTKMPIIGGSSESVAAFIRSDKTGVKSARDLLKPKGNIVIGGSGYGSIKDVSMLAAMNLLGVRNPIYVTGYGGAGPIRLAYERAEINFTQETAVGISRSVLPWMREGWTSVLYQVGFLDGQGNMIKDPVWKGIGVEVPSLAEAYRSMYGKDPSGPEWEAEKALVGGYSLTRLMAMSPKTAAAQVAELRKAFSAMGQDPAFLADWGKSQGAAPRLIPGNEAGDIVASILKARKEAVNILKRLAKP
jgi:tripartite-type tricarboxylate transporter receptor subunit TctC